jgi:hypothetical protein
MEQCAKSAGCSAGCIRHKLLKYEIPIRTLAESQRLLGDRVDFCNKMSHVVKQRYEDPAEIEKLQVAQQKIYADPEKGRRRREAIGNQFRGKPLSPAHKEKIARAARERYKNPEAHEVTSRCKRGPKNAQWRGGISDNKYCYKFTRLLRESIREEHGRRCVMCGCHENGQKLDVHHVNFDKSAGCYGKRWNLVPLCRSCHAWTTTHRWQAFNLLNCHWAKFYDFPV